MVLRDKKRDMARSVLPSTARKSAREDRRHAHKATRSRVREALRHDWDDEADVALDPQRYASYRGIKTVVYDRRGADKVRPLMRWAKANADEFGATPQERYVALRALLPPNIVGWHAMTHVEMLDEYDTDPRWWRYHDRTTESYESRKARLVDALSARLDRHGELNRLLKDNRIIEADGTIVRGYRLWAGAHDTEDFATWVLRQPRGGGADMYARWMNARSIVADFCDFYRGL